MIFNRGMLILILDYQSKNCSGWSWLTRPDCCWWLQGVEMAQEISRNQQKRGNNDICFFVSSSTRLQRGWSVPAPNSSIDVRLKTHRGDFFLLCFSKKQRKHFFFQRLGHEPAFSFKDFAALLNFFFQFFFDKFINFHFFD